MASQSSRGSMFLMKSVFRSISICSSSASLGWRGKAAEAEEDLQVLRAQVRKLRVRSFIFAGLGGVSLFFGVGWRYENVVTNIY